MTKQEFKEYLSYIHHRYNSDSDFYWEDILKEGKLGSNEEFNRKYDQSNCSILGDKNTFVNKLTDQYYPTKLEKLLK